MILETKRLILRDFYKEDWIKVHQYCSDEEVTKYTYWGPNSEDQTREFINKNIGSQHIVPRTNYELAVIDKSNDELIGNCCINVDGSNAEIGYCISKNYWGCRYATEVSKALLSYGFKELGIQRIYATCRPENLRSARVMEKIGMKKEGHIREHFYTRNRWYDSYLYSIIKLDVEG
ncbi:GNAT family protein [Paenibacillus sp. FSL R5-0407]|uniref:GNAT family N-acetyltransferase n=1 Tax=Paenibacillus sp. FSL R5-0407 TaxID=2975320 RepID=UPI0030F9D230